MRAGRDLALAALLAVLPLVAHAPAWWQGRLLGPGDGAALHYPLKAAVWDAWRRGELPSWNPTIFLGTPLLAAYRPGAFFPTVAALSPLPTFVAFQVLVLLSLSSAAVLTYAYLRRLGAARVGAWFAGLAFALGPYLVGHLGDTSTVVAAPALPLLLLAAEAWVARQSAVRAAGLAAALALILLAGSPEAARAGGALLVARLVVALIVQRQGWRRLAAGSALAVLAGVLLAAPQVVPALLAAGEAGRPLTGLADSSSPLPGATGLILRYASHTPAPALAAAALPLALSQTPVLVLGAGLFLSLALQWGRGPLSEPGALALVFDFTLCVLAGLSLSTQWRTRRERLGRRLRDWFLAATLASAAALSVSAAALGPLPETLAGAVGVMALALVVYFPQAASPDPLRAGLWLLPLTVSFLLQPHARQAWRDAPTRAELHEGTGTRAAIDRAMGARRSERNLTLVREWPRVDARDLAYGGLAALAGRRTANGYDPMVPMRTRQALGGMGVGGTLPMAFLRTDPARLEALGIRWVQVPSSVLGATPGSGEWAESLDLPVEPGRPRFFPLPIGPANEVRLVSWLADGVEVPQGTVVAEVEARLATGRAFALPLRAGLETAEWAFDRKDVRERVAHWKAPVAESWPGPGGGFLGHRFLAALALPGRYYVDGIRVRRVDGRGRFYVGRMAAWDAVTGRLAPVSRAAAYVSDGAHFVETAATPTVRLFELPASPGAARVVERLRVLGSDAAVLEALRFPLQPGPSHDPRREALASADAAEALEPPARGRSSRAEVVRLQGGRVEVRAEGPGILVLSEAWDPGWAARLDGAPARLLRVNYVQMGVVLPAGTHRITLRHRPRGLVAGALLAGLAAAALGAAVLRERRARVS